jgi:cytochrome c biogenesis protein CcdA
LDSTQLEILPLLLVMVMGPQILTAIFLVTSEQVVKNSLAMIVGVLLAATLGLTIWSLVVRGLGVDDPGASDGPTTMDYVVAALLALLAIRIWMTRGEAEVPKWMSALQEAEPKRAFSLGFLLILLMPTDIIATISTANLIHDAGLDAVDGWPLVAGTTLLMALPFLAYSLLGRRAREAMPGIREWLTTHSWLVNLVVVLYFIYSVLS